MITRLSHSGIAFKSLVTLVLAFLHVGAIGDLSVRYLPVLQNNPGIPRSLLIVGGSLLLGAIFLILQIWFPGKIQFANRLRRRAGWLRLVVAGVVAAAASYLLVYTGWGEIASAANIHTLVLIDILVLLGWLVTSPQERFMDWQSLLAAGILLGSAFSFAVALQGVSAYPFSQGWSEGNRIWDYSVLYGRRLYLYPAELPLSAFIDPGRQSLWGLPFLLPSVSILGARLWSALVFTVPYILLGWFIFPAEKQRLGVWLLAGLWSFLFLNQGPIYTPLVLAAILVAGARRLPFWLAAVLVGLAGYYAVTSRYTWLFAPAMWAVLVQFLEEPNLRSRWLRSAGLGIAGILGGYGIGEITRLVQERVQGIAAGAGVISAEGFSSYVGRQPLLWERLWPNTTFSQGIILALVLAVLPLAILIFSYGRRNRWMLDIWQKLLIWGEMLAFLGVGLVVSVKIGGGGNLHNMDMLLISLLFLAGLAWRNGGSSCVTAPQTQPLWVRVLLLLVVFIPAAPDLLSARPIGSPPPIKVQEAMNTIRAVVDKAKQAGPVLFVDQRQLLTFGYVQDVPLIAEYEKKMMMDQALSANAAYFAPFYQDLAANRFNLIVSEPLVIQFQGDNSDRQFTNENDAWVKWVSIPVLCYYEPLETFSEVGVKLHVPRSQPFTFPDLECPQ